MTLKNGGGKKRLGGGRCQNAGAVVWQCMVPIVYTFKEAVPPTLPQVSVLELLMALSVDEVNVCVPTVLAGPCMMMDGRGLIEYLCIASGRGKDELPSHLPHLSFT